MLVAWHNFGLARRLIEEANLLAMAHTRRKKDQDEIVKDSQLASLRASFI